MFKISTKPDIRTGIYDKTLVSALMRAYARCMHLGVRTGFFQTSAMMILSCSFGSWLIKRTLKLPKQYSSICDPRLPQSYLLQRKIIFCEGNSDTIDSNRIGVVAMKSLSDDPESLYRELESHFNTVFTTEILTDSVNSTNPTDVRKRLTKIRGWKNVT